MTITMNDSHIGSIAQVGAFIRGVDEGKISFRGKSREEKYVWVKETLTKFQYFRLKKKEKSIVRTFIMQMTGYSKSQLTRLTATKKKTGQIHPQSSSRHRFPKIYTPEDVALLIDTDKVHDRLSGPATKKIFERMYDVFKDTRFSRIKHISVSHIYNLRGRRQYRSQTYFFQKTKPVKISIGERRKPAPDGQPGFIRVDTVHQGDLEKEKGVYHINCIDEITQWEIVGSAEKISEHFLEPLLRDLIAQFPFRILGFHSDNGSEYINKVVAKLLNKLLVEQTKSRARHCNDNALVKSKNGAIIRKHLGYIHIPQRYASAINDFCRDHLNVYLNFHRPCGFATTITDHRGKEKKIYKQEDYLTPYAKLKSLPNASQHLIDKVSLEALDKIACDMSDNECAARMQKAKVELFKQFSKQKLQLPTTYTYAILGSLVD